MRLKEAPIQKKHIHSWTKVFAHAGTFGGKWVQRTCADCKKIQYGHVDSCNIVPDSVLHLAEAEWIDGEMPMQQSVNQYAW